MFCWFCLLELIYTNSNLKIESEVQKNEDLRHLLFAFNHESEVAKATRDILFGHGKNAVAERTTRSLWNVMRGVSFNTDAELRT
ncbi:hypothetical protein TNCV_1223341 [Trichonephila clavipes]|nr:hypothetical protein TNCV_1223341 [Trichonephila clavipes]